MSKIFYLEWGLRTALAYILRYGLNCGELLSLWLVPCSGHTIQKLLFQQKHGNGKLHKVARSSVFLIQTKSS